MYLLVEASSGQEWYYCQVSLTFGQPLDQADLWSDVTPLVEASSDQVVLVVKSGTTSGQLDIWSAFGSG